MVLKTVGKKGGVLKVEHLSRSAAAAGRDSARGGGITSSPPHTN